jgi:tRNA A37 threonylcarbamoyltransferase TsaD
MADWILGIETSCDETSAAVLRQGEQGVEIAGLTILSQDVHKIFGGVVAEPTCRRSAPWWTARWPMPASRWAGSTAWR